MLLAGSEEQGGQQIEPQERQVGDVVFADLLVFEVGMDQAQSPQGTFSQWVVAQVRDDQPLFVADHDVFNQAVTADEYADLAADVVGNLDQTGGQLLGTEFGRRDAPPVKPLQGLDLALF